MQADASARTHYNMTILFAAANEGTDANSEEKLIWEAPSPGTAKNVITVGAVGK